MSIIRLLDKAVAGVVREVLRIVLELHRHWESNKESENHQLNISISTPLFKKQISLPTPIPNRIFSVNRNTRTIRKRIVPAVAANNTTIPQTKPSIAATTPSIQNSRPIPKAVRPVSAPKPAAKAVKATPVLKAKAAAKAVKTTPVPKAAAKVVKATPVPKAAAKVVKATPAAKPVAKAVKATPAAKPVAKAVKATPAAKPVAKAVKATPAAKPVAKAVKATPAAKPVAKAVKSTPAAKPAAKAVKATPVSEPAVQAVKATPAAKPVIPTNNNAAETLNKKKTNEVIITTSIGPGKVEVQQNAIKTWVDAGFRVVSLNSAEEINTLKPYFPTIEFQEISRNAQEKFGKPYIYIYDFMQYLSSTDYKVCGIVNSDIHFLEIKDNFMDFIYKESIGSLVYGHRMDVDNLNNLNGRVSNGVDYFFFDRDLITIYEDDGLCMGQPAWDWWMVCVAAAAHKPNKRVLNTVAYHIDHPQTWMESLNLYLIESVVIDKYLRKLYPEALYYELNLKMWDIVISKDGITYQG